MLADPAWSSLTGRHAYLALRSGRAARYVREGSPFAGLEALEPEALADLVRLVPANDFVALFAEPSDLDFSGWRITQRIEVTRMVCDTPVSSPKREPIALSAVDVPEMLALVELTQPGPFGPRTIEMGRYLGFREKGQLVAMGGERLKPSGATEVSGICTAPGARGRGLAEDVVRAVAASIQARGEQPFLHIARGSASEASATRLYSRLGFREAQRASLVIVQRDTDPA